MKEPAACRLFFYLGNQHRLDSFFNCQQAARPGKIHFAFVEVPIMYRPFL